MVELINRLEHLFYTHGNQAYGPEPVTLIEHSMQCAGLAAESNLPVAMIVAAGLHDIGHLLLLDDGERYSDGGDRHEFIGSDFLASYLPGAVITVIQWHVEAKRYLVSAENDYFDTLSAGSIASLEQQGGPMTESEMLTFRSVDGYKETIMLRRFDDRAKVPGAEGMQFELFLNVIHGLAARRL